MAVNNSKNMEVYDGTTLAAHVVYSVGCGSVASVVLPTLCRMGVDKFVMFDGDTVSDANISNQAFYASDIGKPKPLALGRILKQINPECRVKAVQRHWTPEEDADKMQGIVLCMADSMEVRRQLIDAISGRHEIALFIDTRTSLFSCTCYASLPEDINRLQQIRLQTMETDEEIEALAREAGELSACGLAQSVFPTIQAGGALVAARVIEWLKDRRVSMLSTTDYYHCAAFKMPIR